MRLRLSASLLALFMLGLSGIASADSDKDPLAFSSDFSLDAAFEKATSPSPAQIFRTFQDAPTTMRCTQSAANDGVETCIVQVKTEVFASVPAAPANR